MRAVHVKEPAKNYSTAGRNIRAERKEGKQGSQQEKKGGPLDVYSRELCPSRTYLSVYGRKKTRVGDGEIGRINEAPSGSWSSGMRYINAGADEKRERRKKKEPRDFPLLLMQLLRERRQFACAKRPCTGG